MATYRTTVILKTDVVDSTLRLADQTQAEMSLQRKQHKLFISEIAGTYHGSVFQEEGDAYWIEFPSVTNACLAAIEMHQSLRSMQAGIGERRLAIRAVITVGDILYQEQDTIGMTMSLTARIEKVTPPDEIYLSHAAWLVLNKAEIQTAFTSEFNFKGFIEPEKVYRVIQKYKTRVLTNQYIVLTDVRSWMWYTASKRVEDVEDFLLAYDDLMNEICNTFGGIIRNTSGDQYFLTFSDPNAFFPAIERLCLSWRDMMDRYKLGITVVAHKGDLNVLRSYLFGNNIHATFYLEQLTRAFYPARESISVAISGAVKASAQGTIWESGIQEMDRSKITDKRLQAWNEEYGAYWFITEGTTQATPQNSNWGSNTSMSFKTVVKNGYNQIAERYLAQRTADSDDVHLLSDFMDLLSPGSKILDAGCGGGVPISKILAEYFDVTGVDFSEVQIELARKNVPKAKFICEDLTRLYFPESTFDGICSYYTIIHIPREEHRTILVNFNNMLKNSGVALLCLGAENLVANVHDNFLGTQMYWSHYDSETYLDILSEIGFRIIWSKYVKANTCEGMGHLFVLIEKK